MENYFDCSCDCTDCAVINCDFVKDAVAKQIPKKVIIHTERKKNKMSCFITEKYGFCPTCEHVFTEYDFSEYCIDCGQKLDWGDV